MSFWDNLSSRTTSDTSKVVGELLIGSSDSGSYISIFRSKDMSFHMLISPEREIKEPLTDPKAAGLKIRILNNHLVEGRKRQDYIDIQCTAKPHIEAFTEIVKEISKLILDDGLDPIKAINMTIRKWKSFWGKIKENIMSENDQLGLLGELYILDDLQKREVVDTLSAWSKSENPIHDFEFPYVSLEVKTTLRSRRQHIINGLEQLETNNGKPLYVASFLASKVGGDGVSVDEMVKNITSILEKEPEKYELFNERLALRGYRPDHDKYYAQNKFNLMNLNIFPVDDEFPKMTSSSFSNPISSRVTNVRYTLDFEGLPNISILSSEYSNIFCKKC